VFLADSGTTSDVAAPDPAQPATVSLLVEVADVDQAVRVALGDASADDVPDTSGPRQELVRAQRDKLAQLYRDGEISDDIRRSISRSLDLQEPRPFR